MSVAGKTKRNFIIFLKEVTVNPKLNINNLSGEGRLDLVCRVISSSFFLSNSFRNDTNLFLFLQQDSILITLHGNKLNNLNPDERSIGGFLKKIFKNIEGVETHPNKDISGYSWQYFGLEDFPKYFPTGYLLDRTGKNYDYLQKENVSEYVFVLGDHLGLNNNDKSFLTQYILISLGNKELHASNCVIIIHHLLDNKI